MRRLGELSTRRPAWVLLILIAVTAALAPGVLRLELRTDGAVLYPEENEVVLRTEADARLFHEQERLVVLITPKTEGARIESLEGLRFLRELHDAVQSRPGLVSRRVRSLSTVLNPSPGELIANVPDMLDELPADGDRLEDLGRRISASPHGRGLYLSRDGTRAALYVALEPESETAEWIDGFRESIRALGTDEFELSVLGSLAAEVDLGRVVLRDLARLIPAIVVVIAILLSVFLRSLGCVLATLAEVGLVLVWTFGAMGYAGAPLTLITTVLPVLLLTMSITDEVHLLGRFRAVQSESENVGAAMRRALSEVVPPIALTSWTTAASLCSFALTPLAPLRDFGLFSALGVLLALFLSLTLVPALVCVLPASWLRPAPPGTATSRIGPARTRPERVSVKTASLLCALSVLVLGPGAALLQPKDSWLENLDPDSELVRATREYDDVFWGSYRYDVVLRCDEPAYFQFPDGMRFVENLERDLRDAPHVGGIVSYLDAHEVVASMEGNTPPVSKLPREMVMRYSRNLMKIQRRIDLQEYLARNGLGVRLRLLIPNADYAKTAELETFLDDRLADLGAGSELEVHTSGDLAAAQATVREIIRSMLRSSSWTLLAIAVLLTLSFRRPRMVLACLFPLLTGIALLLGTMGWAGVSLGIATSMLAAITLGIGVDYGIHSLHAYRRALEETRDRRLARQRVAATTGVALFWNTVILVSGMSVLVISEVPPNRMVGGLLAMGMIFCFLAARWGLPGLLAWALPSANAPKEPESRRA